MAPIGGLLYETPEEDEEALQNSSDRRLAIATPILLICALLLMMLLSEWCVRRAIRRHNAALSAASNVGSGPAAVVFVDLGQRLRQLRELPLGIINKDKEGGDGEGLGSGSGSEGRDDEKDVCAICLEEFSSGEEVRELPNCSHMFHRLCIDPWLLLYSSQCPVCRGKTLTL